MKNILILLFIAACLSTVSCSEWTEAGNLDFTPATAAELDPQAYEAYLQSLRQYKLSDHKVMIVTIAGTSSSPTRQNQHPMSMADSVDYICMTDVAGLHSVVVGEIAEVRGSKGTNVLCVVDYSAIEDAWKAVNGDDALNDNSLAANYGVWCGEQAALQLSYCNAYGFDGIKISYMGRYVTQSEQSGQTAFMAAVTEWHTANPDKRMFFCGYARNLNNNTILQDCTYIIVPCESSESSGQLTTTVQTQLTTGVPTDRTVIEVAIPSVSNPVQVGATPQVAAGWVNELSTRFTKSGMSVANAQDDYFYTDRIYKNIREAIAIMNTVSEN